VGREAALRKALRLEGKELVGEDRAVTQLGWIIVIKKKKIAVMLLLQRGAADRDDDEVGEEAGRGRRRPRHRAVVGTASS